MREGAGRATRAGARGEELAEPGLLMSLAESEKGSHVSGLEAPQVSAVLHAAHSEPVLSPQKHARTMA